MLLPTGTYLGRYEIRSFIGAGGMGEVYLAQDAQLGRPVALKLLPASLTNSREHLRRFEQEANTTSLLNHPNILTIHEVGCVESAHFIVAEFVEGRTLRQLIGSEENRLGELLDVAMQVASGLLAAHRAGVVHRDIKPENIMVRHDGYVKILDFGLAKLTQGVAAAKSHAGDSTVSALNTNSGEILGTVRYMSPEQLRGEKIDHRADIWGLGVVLYEMLTKHSPFEANTSAGTIASIIEHEPPPLAVHVARCPPALQRIVSKTLTKKVERRYQSAADLLADLRRFKEEPRNRIALERVLTPLAGGSDSYNTSGRRAVEALNRLVSNTAAEAGSFFRINQTRVLTAVLLLLVLLLIASVVWRGSFALAAMLTSGACILILLYQVVGQRQARAGRGPFGTIRLLRLTETGKAVEAAISPDGRYVAYVNESSGKQSLWVRQVATTSNVQIVTPADVTFQGVSFSPDGNFISYVLFENTKKGLWLLYQVPVLGGVPKRLLVEAHTPATFSPDGHQIAFVRGYPSEGLTVLMVANADGTSERRLATRRTPDEYGWRGGPSWSPSGERIACTAGVYDVDMCVVEVAVRDGVERIVTPQRWPWAGRVAWLRDGRGLVLAARDQATGLTQLWHISYPDGRVRRITNDLSDYSSRSVSLSTDARFLVSVQSDYSASIWLVPASEPRRPRQITDGRSDGLYGLAWTPEGRIVYTSRASGMQNIWQMNRDGSSPVQLTAVEGMNYHPSVSLDGRFVVFVSTRAGEPNIWRMEINGDNPQQLTHGGNPSWPTCTPDGRWVVFKSQRSGKRILWRLPIEGGDPVAITEGFTGLPTVSPDGHLIACEYWDERLNSRYTMAVVSLEGDTPLRVFDMPPTFGNSIHLTGSLRWSRDGRAITYVDNREGVSNIWSQPLDGSAPEQLTDFNSERIFWFDWSPDGQEIACARGTRISDVVLIGDTGKALPK